MKESKVVCNQTLRNGEKMEIEAKIKDMIIRNFMAGEKNPQLSTDVSFLEKGIIDSTGVLELVSLLERIFDIKVKDEELVPDNLDSINSLVKFVSQKLKQD